MNKIVIADKSNIIQHALATKLISAGYVIRIAGSWSELNSYLKYETIDLVIMDAAFPDWQPAEAVRDLKNNYPALCVIITFKALTIPEVVGFVRGGADDCIAKPLDMTRVMEQIRLLEEAKKTAGRKTPDVTDEARRTEERKEASEVIIATEEIRRMMEKIKNHSATVLLCGEAGVLKTSYVKHLHKISDRAGHPLVTIECSALSAGSLEIRLYGYETRNQTNAVTRVPGALEAAGRGTLLLKDIDAIPLSVQSGLTAALSEKQYTPVGGKEPIPFHARVIATTNKRIEQLVGEGQIRPELVYALSVVRIDVPPLRERRDMIPQLLKSTLARLCISMDLPDPEIDEACLRELVEYDWPGNEREFLTVIERALTLLEGDVLSVRLPRERVDAEVKDNFIFLPEDKLSLREYMRDKEEEIIRLALRKNGGKKKKTAAYLGISERSLRGKLSEMDTENEEDDGD